MQEPRTTRMRAIPLAVGQRVRTISGRSLGAIERIAGDAFQLRLDSGAEMWLGPNVLFTCDGEIVTLICERDGLARYCTAAPLSNSDQYPPGQEGVRPRDV